MHLTNRTLAHDAPSRCSIWGVLVLCSLASIVGVAQQPKVGRCGRFASFVLLNQATVDLQVSHRVGISSPILATVSAHADIPVRVFVDMTGSVVCAKATGKWNPLLMSLAENAAMKWTFSPYLSHGSAVPFRGIIVFRVDM